MTPPLIAIVEDEEHLAQGLIFNLEAEGYRTHHESDGDAALAWLLEATAPQSPAPQSPTERPAVLPPTKLSSRPEDAPAAPGVERPAAPHPTSPAAILLDVMLPGRDGFSIVRALREAGRYTPVLLLTARGRNEDILEGFAAGADDYLPKPFDLNILLARLTSLLRRMNWQTTPTHTPVEPIIPGAPFMPQTGVPSERSWLAGVEPHRGMGGVEPSGGPSPLPGQPGAPFMPQPGAPSERSWLAGVEPHRGMGGVEPSATPPSPQTANHPYTLATRTIDFDTLEIHILSTNEAPAKTIHLTLMEADLLRYLLDHPNKIISRKELLENVWRVHEDTDTRAIDNFIVRLRRYLEPDPTHPIHLLTVRGIGYRFLPATTP